MSKVRQRHIVGVEYDARMPVRYDGVSEYRCLGCGYREGRWSGAELIGGDYETRSRGPVRIKVSGVPKG